MFSDPSGHMGLLEVIQAQTIAVMMQVARIGPAFAAGGAAIGKVWNALGASAQNAAQNVMMLFSKLDVGSQVRLGNRILDFSLRAGSRLAYVESKYKIPTGVGDAMNRLVGQLNAVIANGQAQAVLWTYKEPTAAELRLLYQQLGANASRVQLVHGLDGLYRWIEFYFRIEGY